MSVPQVLWGSTGNPTLLIPDGESAGIIALPGDAQLSGQSTRMEIRHETHLVCVAEWIPGGPPNPGAQTIVAELAGIYVEFTGAVLLHSVSPDNVAKLTGVYPGKAIG